MSMKFKVMSDALDDIKRKMEIRAKIKTEKKEELVKEPEINADVNSDGVVDEQDVEVVKKKVKKKKAEQAE